MDKKIDTKFNVISISWDDKEVFNSSKKMTLKEAIIHEAEGLIDGYSHNDPNDAEDHGLCRNLKISAENGCYRIDTCDGNFTVVLC